jgi:Tfp pilus assembly protein PilW
MPKKHSKKESGYTIIETMIAVSLFTVIVVLGIGSLLNANRLHQKSRDMRSILDNLSFIMDDMSRNIRTGSNYYCLAGAVSALPSPFVAQSCPAAGFGIAFEASGGNLANNGDQWVYYILGGKIYKSTAGDAGFQITPDEVVIDQVNGFSIYGAEPPPGDTRQPFVTIRLVGHITTKNVTTPFSLQTSVTQRLVDVGS